MTVCAHEERELCVNIEPYSHTDLVGMLFQFFAAYKPKDTETHFHRTREIRINYARLDWSQLSQ